MKGWRAIAAAVAAAVWLASGIYVVRSDERGVVRRLGRSIGSVRPGIGWDLPWPLSRVDRLRTNRSFQVAIGYDPVGEVLGRPGEPFRRQHLTADRNVIEIEATVQYRIADPPAFLFRVAASEAALAAISLRAIARDAASSTIEEIWVLDRPRLADRTREAIARAFARRYGPGIEVVSVNLKRVAPPDEVRDAFDDCIRARADRERLIRDASTYRESIVPEARGDAARAVGDAKAYAVRRVEMARGDAERFEEILAAYREQPQVMLERLYIDACAEILPRLRKIVLPEGGALDLGVLEAEPAAGGEE
ncbi:MAG: FtsH protease activity modulator HflK [Planctomycetes bacterium]|nr:FtsH protease activity modulator HflK [Planctomycetota bacterium]